MSKVTMVSLPIFAYTTGYTEDAVYQKRSKSNWKDENITNETLNGIKINVLEYNKWCCSNGCNINSYSISKEKIQFIKKSIFLNNKQIKESLLRKIAKLTNTDLSCLLIKAPDNHVMVNTLLYENLLIKLQERLG